MPVATLPSGLVVQFREWEFDDMQRWAKEAETAAQTQDFGIVPTVGTLERVLDPGPYPFLKEGATAIEARRLLKKDIQWWLFRARAASHPDDPEHGVTGEDFVFDWVCSRNKKHDTSPAKVRLCDLRVRPLSPEGVEHLQTGKPLSVTMSGGEVVSFTLATMQIDEPMREVLNRRTKALRQRQKGAKAVEPTPAEILACQIVSVSSLGENQSFERRAAYIGKLRFRDWATLQRAISAVAPEIDLRVDCRCDECGARTEVLLPLTHGFFAPRLGDEAFPEEDEKDQETPKDQETSDTTTG